MTSTEPLRSKFKKPPPMWSISLTLVLLVFFIDSFSRQLRLGFDSCLLAVVYLPAAAAILGDYLYRLAESPIQTKAASRWRWAVLPVAAFVYASATWNRWPLRLRFELSRPAFEEALARARAGHAFVEGEWIGLFPIRIVREVGPEAIEFVFDAGGVKWASFCRDPSAREPCVRLSGGWHVLSE